MNVFVTVDIASIELHAQQKSFFFYKLLPWCKTHTNLIRIFESIFSSFTHFNTDTFLCNPRHNQPVVFILVLHSYSNCAILVVCVLHQQSGHRVCLGIVGLLRCLQAYLRLPIRYDDPCCVEHIRAPCSVSRLAPSHERRSEEQGTSQQDAASAQVECQVV